MFVYIAACWAIVAVTVGAFGPRTGMRNLERLTESAPDSGAAVSEAAASVAPRAAD
ncbi:hypothetical protein [Gandjariella thermophila]|uniref:Uncharacterized protein n=1 Tax=Gandjariella thermophila TaxID=1931992 RepID=A0A4D4J4P2_9PSEU|nr:hypothetical protein [Gandjariella thermophila]GDY31645.1 hypothetical protein GTS_32780 [Gandjariella thermophila]